MNKETIEEMKKELLKLVSCEELLSEEDLELLKKGGKTGVEFFIENDRRNKVATYKVNEVLALIAQQNQHLIEEIEKIIINEITTAQKEGQPTSRLTSLFNRFSEVIIKNK